MIVPRRFDARFIVGAPDGPRSGLWRVWRTKNEVYVASEKTGGIEKFSFHSGEDCRRAFTSERGAPEGLSDRATIKWRRTKTPPLGEKRGVCVLEVGLPTDYLSTSLERPSKPAIWIEAAPMRMTTVIEMLFTSETEGTVRSLMEPVNRRVHVYTQLPTGEAFVVSSHHASFAGENFVVPASHHQNKDYVVSNEDPENTGRPARITIFASVKDGDRMTSWEYGAYQSAPLDGARPGFAKFSRTTVLDKSSS